MVFLIGGSSHAGKTALAQRLLEKHGYPYLSIDHLKMGLIRSGMTALTPTDEDERLTEYLWPIVREMVKTAIENGQNLIVEGCYIPFDWQKDFENEYLSEIKYLCIVFSERYIRAHFDDILRFESIIEKRLCDQDLTEDALILDNKIALEGCKKHGLGYALVDENYDPEALCAFFSI